VYLSVVLSHFLLSPSHSLPLTHSPLFSLAHFFSLRLVLLVPLSSPFFSSASVLLTFGFLVLHLLLCSSSSSSSSSSLFFFFSLLLLVLLLLVLLLLLLLLFLLLLFLFVKQLGCHVC